MQRFLLIAVWSLVAFGLLLAAMMIWNRFHHHRSPDQQVLIRKSK